MVVSVSAVYNHDSMAERVSHSILLAREKIKIQRVVPTEYV